MRVLDAIFIQPTYSCALNCKGCYVKESTKQEQQHGPELFYDLIDYILDSGRLHTKQITIAADDIPGYNPVASRTMRGLLYHTLERFAEERPKDIELHLTAHTTNTLLQYDLGILPERTVDIATSLISYSAVKPSDLEGIEHYKYNRDEVGPREDYAEINYNYMPDGNWDKYKKAVEAVDMSYYILHKPGLGRENSQEQIRLFKEGLKEIDTWPRELKRKVIVDSCVTDSYDYMTTGYGCSANTRKIHVWPDGHVTGCPYNKDGGRPAYTLEELLANIEEATSRYEFRGCTIPREYYTPGRRNRAAGLDVIS